jgi:hypothetical protein
MLKIFRFIFSFRFIDLLVLIEGGWLRTSTRWGSGFRMPNFAGFAMEATLLLLPMMMMKN